MPMVEMTEAEKSEFEEWRDNKRKKDLIGQVITKLPSGRFSSSGRNIIRDFLGLLPIVSLTSIEKNISSVAPAEEETVDDIAEYLPPIVSTTAPPIPTSGW